MRSHPLQEAAKFAAGLVAADFFTIIWFAAAGMLPVSFLGTTFTSQIVLPGVVFDLALFLILVHYGWHIGKIPAMRERTYVIVAGILFTIVALAHLWRIFTGANLVLASWQVPLWLSWIGVAATAYLAYSSFHFALRIKNLRR